MLTDTKCLCVATELNFMDYHIKTLHLLEMLYFEIYKQTTDAPKKSLTSVDRRLACSDLKLKHKTQNPLNG